MARTIIYHPHKKIKKLIVCPKCGYKGLKVLTKTVKHLTQNNNISDELEFNICTNRNCNVVYFSDEVIFERQDISTKVWYKSSLEDFIVCYCHNIKLLDIVSAVAYLGLNATKEDILKYLNKELTQDKCEILNPISQNCDRLFENAIEYAKKAYKEN